MPTTFTLHEPSPHLNPSRTPFGRGGAGNRTSQPTSSSNANTKSPKGTALAQPPSSISSTLQTNTIAAAHSLTQNKPFHTGRGGAGNLRPADDERRLFSFDEELDHQLATVYPRAPSSAGTGAAAGASGRRRSANGLLAPGERVPVYHIGRGGSGNAVTAMPDTVGESLQGRRGSDSDGSEGSDHSGKKGVGGWVKGLTGRRI